MPHTVKIQFALAELAELTAAVNRAAATAPAADRLLLAELALAFVRAQRPASQGAK